MYTRSLLSLFTLGLMILSIAISSCVRVPPLPEQKEDEEDSDKITVKPSSDDDWVPQPVTTLEEGCGWDDEQNFFNCGSTKLPPDGQKIMACPSSLKHGEAGCPSSIGRIGCCTENGDLWYCDLTGVTILQYCGSPGDGETSDEETGGRPTTGDDESNEETDEEIVDEDSSL